MNDLNTNTVNKITKKISNKDNFIPLNLLINVIKEHNIKKIAVEEEESELYFETIHGQGKIYFKNGNIYEGNVRYGILQSETDIPSIMKFTDGTEYIGDMENNKISGKGMYIFPVFNNNENHNSLNNSNNNISKNNLSINSNSFKDIKNNNKVATSKNLQSLDINNNVNEIAPESNIVCYYKGDVLNGLRHGFGVYKNKQEDLMYEGEWVNGLKHGFGELKIKDMIYIGNFCKGAKHSNGKLSWINTNNYYEGEFYNNNINGNGYMVWRVEKEKYIGKWNNNKQEGIGIQIWYEPKGELKYLKNRYVGEWKDGLRNGYGVFFYSDGSKYEGQWEDNIKNGFGIFTFSDGTQYAGSFLNDRMVDYLNPKPSIEKINQLVTGDSFNKHSQGKNITTGNLTGTIANQTNNYKSKQKNQDNNSNVFGIIHEDPRENCDNANNIKEINESNKNNLNVIYKNESAPSKINPSTALKKTKLAPINRNNLNLNPSSTSVSNLHNNIKLNNNLDGRNQGNVNLQTSNTIQNTNNSIASTTNYNKRNSKYNNNLSNNNNDLKSKVSNIIEYNNEESCNILDEIIPNKLIKESDSNPFVEMLDISDILEGETDIESSLSDIQCLLLRYLSDMKNWYKIYSTGKDINFTKSNLNPNDSYFDDMNTTNINVKASKVMFNPNKIQLGSTNNLKIANVNDRNLTKDNNLANNNNNNNNNHLLVNQKENLKKEDPNSVIITEGLNINADIGYAMEMKDLWRFIRDGGILSSELSLADFNRLYFNGPRNFIEMFQVPENLSTNKYYSMIYSMVKEAKRNFEEKYKRNGNYGNYKYAGKKPFIEYELEYNNSDGNTFDNKQIKENYEFDIHNKRNVILLRQFYESIVRLAYLFNQKPNANISNNKDNNTNTLESYKYTSNNKDTLSKKIKSLVEYITKYNYKIKQPKKEKPGLTGISSINDKNNLNTVVKENSSLNSSIVFNPNPNLNNVNLLNNNTNLNDINNIINYNLLKHGLDYVIDLVNNYDKKDIYSLFKDLFKKSKKITIKGDIAVSYRYIYENCINENNDLKEAVSKELLVIFINRYHNNKLTITEENRYSNTIFRYIENLLDTEMIYYEFCELIGYIAKRMYIKSISMSINTNRNFNNINSIINNENKEIYLENIYNIVSCFSKSKSYKNKVKLKYHYPILEYHKIYEEQIKEYLILKEEENKKAKEKLRWETENKAMVKYEKEKIDIKFEEYEDFNDNEDY